MIDIEAALGTSQLHRLAAYVERRNALARRYDAALKGLALQLPTVLTGNHSAFHLYGVRVKTGAAGKPHRQVFEELRGRGIGVNVHYTPVHLHPYYRRLGFSPGQYPEAESYGCEAITLPMYPTMTDAMQDEVVDALHQTLEH
jgi:dTDP-4-amino-4,6-dideoxygalactose transaminase